MLHCSIIDLNKCSLIICVSSFCKISTIKFVHFLCHHHKSYFKSFTLTFSRCLSDSRVRWGSRTHTYFWLFSGLTKSRRSPRHAFWLILGEFQRLTRYFFTFCFPGIREHWILRPAWGGRPCRWSSPCGRNIKQKE